MAYLLTVPARAFALFFSVPFTITYVTSFFVFVSLEGFSVLSTVDDLGGGVTFTSKVGLNMDEAFPILFKSAFTVPPLLMAISLRYEAR